jgi:hypothetical protein
MDMGQCNPVNGMGGNKELSFSPSFAWIKCLINGEIPNDSVLSRDFDDIFNASLSIHLLFSSDNFG